MGEVVRLMTSPKQIVSNIGKHKLVLDYLPDAPGNYRWRWQLRVTHVYEYSGYESTPAMCRVSASKYVEAHDTMEDNHEG